MSLGFPATHDKAGRNEEEPDMKETQNAIKKIIIRLMNNTSAEWRPLALDETWSWSRVFDAMKKVCADSYERADAGAYIAPDLVLIRCKAAIWQLARYEKQNCFSNGQIWDLLTEIQSILAKSIERGWLGPDEASLKELDSAGVFIDPIMKRFWHKDPDYRAEEKYDPNSEDVAADLI